MTVVHGLTLRNKRKDGKTLYGGRTSGNKLLSTAQLSKRDQILCSNLSYSARGQSMTVVHGQPIVAQQEKVH